MTPEMFEHVPVLVGRAERPRGTVIFLHGQGADAVTNTRELALLRGAGFDVVGVDAPEHGRRYDPARDARWAEDEMAALRIHIQEAAAEIPVVVDACIAAGLAAPYAITGVSLGGFTLWQALRCEPRLVTAVPILGSPVLPGDPAPDPEPWLGRDVLAIQAESDEVVPMEPTRRVVTGIGGTLHVVQGSPHHVPELDWWALWGLAIRWLGEPDRHGARRPGELPERTGA